MGDKENHQNTIVTLTTDFGRQDYYLALLKGAMLCKNPQLNIVDLTHEIKNYDIIRAAFIFKNAWKHFPAGTIHVLSVNDYNSGLPSFIAIKHEEHYFLGPDNGIFSLVFEDIPTDIYKLPPQKDSNFELKDIFSLAIGHISAGHGLYTIGEQQESMLTRINFQPVTGPDHIRGAVIHIDNYDNVITNVNKALFEKVGRNRPFNLSFKGHSPISNMSSYYHDVHVGEELCMFNSADHLEVAINMGNAAGLLGFDLEDTVQIDFFNLEHED